MAAVAASPAFWTAVASAGGGIGSALSNSDQELHSFENQHGDGTQMDLDPRAMLRQAGDRMDSVGRMIQQEKFTLPGATVQTPPAFTGGGLPMPIGLTGHDIFEGQTPAISRDRGIFGLNPGEDFQPFKDSGPTVIGGGNFEGGPEGTPAGSPGNKDTPATTDDGVTIGRRDPIRIGPYGETDAHDALSLLRMLR